MAGTPCLSLLFDYLFPLQGDLASEASPRGKTGRTFVIEREIAYSWTNKVGQSKKKTSQEAGKAMIPQQAPPPDYWPTQTFSWSHSLPGRPSRTSVNVKQALPPWDDLQAVHRCAPNHLGGPTGMYGSWVLTVLGAGVLGLG